MSIKCFWLLHIKVLISYHKPHYLNILSGWFRESGSKSTRQSLSTQTSLQQHEHKLFLLEIAVSLLSHFYASFWMINFSFTVDVDDDDWLMIKKEVLSIEHFSLLLFLRFISCHHSFYTVEICCFLRKIRHVRFLGDDVGGVDVKRKEWMTTVKGENRKSDGKCLVSDEDELIVVIPSVLFGIDAWFQVTGGAGGSRAAASS